MAIDKKRLGIVDPDEGTTVADPGYNDRDTTLRPVWHPETGEKIMVDNLNYHDFTINLGYKKADPTAPVIVQGAEEEEGVSLFPVWDPRGNKHMVDELNKREMVEKLGWFDRAPLQTGDAGSTIPAPPIVAAKLPEPAEPEKRKPGRPKKDGAIPDGEPGAPLEHVSQNEGATVELTSMSPEGLRRFAKEKFGMNFSPNVPHEQVLEAVIVEAEAGS